MQACLCRDVCYRSCCDTCHSMNPSVSRARGFGFLLYGAGGGKNVFVCLDGKLVSCKFDEGTIDTGFDHKSTPKQPFPMVLGRYVMCVACV